MLNRSNESEQDAILNMKLDDDAVEQRVGSVPTLDPNSDRLLKVPEVANALGVSTRLVYRRVLLDRSFPVIRLGRVLRVREGALVRWIRLCEAGPRPR